MDMIKLQKQLNNSNSTVKQLLTRQNKQYETKPYLRVRRAEKKRISRVKRTNRSNRVLEREEYKLRDLTEEQKLQYSIITYDNWFNEWCTEQINY